jgi:hypothetical protein
MDWWFAWVEGDEYADPVSICEFEAANRIDVDQLAPKWPLPNVTIVSPVVTTRAEADRILPALLAAKAVRKELVLEPTEEFDFECVRDPSLVVVCNGGTVWPTPESGAGSVGAFLEAAQTGRLRALNVAPREEGGSGP